VELEKGEEIKSIPFNNLPLPKSKLKRISTITAIELFSVFKRAPVIDRYRVSGLAFACTVYGFGYVDP